MNKLIKFLIGIFLILLGIFSALFSTYATIIPISMSFKNYTKLIMIGIFIIIQISVFFIAMTKNYIARETPQHYILINRISNILMFVSIVSTITFFSMNSQTILEHEKSISELYRIIPGLKLLPFYDWILDISVNAIFIWSVCIILDVLAIKSPLIGFDVIFGIKYKRTYTTIFSMVFAILTHKPKTIIESKYKSLGYKISDLKIEKSRPEIKKSEISDQKSRPNLTLISDQKVLEFSNELQTKVLDQDSKKIKSEIINFLIQTYRPNQKIDKFQLKFNLTLTNYRKILEQLKEENIIYTQNRNTYLKGVNYDRNISDNQQTQ